MTGLTDSLFPLLPGLTLAPMLPWPLLAGLGLVGLVLIVLAGGGPLSRGLRLAALLLLCLMLLNVRLIREETRPLPDIAVLVADDSASMQLGARPAQSAAAEAQLRQQLGTRPDLDLRVVHCCATGRHQGTRLFTALEQTLSSLPPDRLAGIILLSDGQIHDIPASLPVKAPLHLLLAGQKTERDRRLVLEQAPLFAQVGQTIHLQLRIDDPGTSGEAPLTVISSDSGREQRMVPLNSPVTLDIPVRHAGPLTLGLITPPVPGELTSRNNQAVLTVQGQRERLRVLLLSGSPHPELRSWRDLLKADPAIDLLHFTLMGAAGSFDPTPAAEMALIPFPVNDLFGDTLTSVDLVILDRFDRSRLLTQTHQDRLAERIRQGGAMLAIASPDSFRPDSLLSGPLGDLLPVRPVRSEAVTGAQIRLRPTSSGQRHPVTARLEAPERWAPWVGLVAAQPQPGSLTLLEDRETAAPVLVAGQAGTGRSAVLLSDGLWLWGRQWQGGGPQRELVRRLVHWLLREPELEEHRLTARLEEGALIARLQTLDTAPPPLIVTAPDGRRYRLALQDDGGGQWLGRLPLASDGTPALPAETSPDSVALQSADGQAAAPPAAAEGLWQVSDGTSLALAADSQLDPAAGPDPEEAALRASALPLKPLLDKNGGGWSWLADGLPEFRVLPPGSTLAASDGRWLGLVRHQATQRISLQDMPLIPPLLLLGPVLLLLVFAWWREAR